jgi:hypothetical protein
LGKLFSLRLALQPFSFHLAGEEALGFILTATQGLNLATPPRVWDWGEEMAWERDFRDPTKSWWGSQTGLDDCWVDDVDFVLYFGMGIRMVLCFHRVEIQGFSIIRARFGALEIWSG